MAKKLLVWLGSASSDDATLVGEKAKKLSELVRIGLPVLNGFVVTTAVYNEFLEKNNLSTKIQHLKTSVVEGKLPAAIEKELAKAKLPQNVIDDIFKAYIQLVGHVQHAPLSLTSSVSSHQVEVKGEANLLLEIKKMLVDAYKENPQSPVALLVQLTVVVEKSGILHTDKPDVLSLPLVEKEKIHISTLLEKAHKHFFFPHTLSWIYGEKNLYITDVKEITQRKENSISPFTATKIYVHLQDYTYASTVAREHVDGVGQLCYEDLMHDNTQHPQSYLDSGKKNEFINELAQRIAEVCAAFSPRCVMYRTSSLTTAEYAKLENGREYESIEPNPVLGYRGAYRYTHDAELFLLEMEAIKQVRNKMGYKNIWLLLPFVRSVKELQDIKKLIASSGLYRSLTFKIWMSVEIPSNVLLLDSFIEQGIDGVTIEPAYLTTLLTGTDKNNRDVLGAYHEDNPASLWAYEHTIKVAHKHKIVSSYSGQKEGIAPSILEKLILWGVSSVSIFPESVDSIRQHISHFEKERAQ
ncbi:MAG TPA: putative PEP-binding protein [Candidatus Eisenbacteria bacterium]|nr:putative PEP-binding protein [Candidatus Eisenbacteria bacterium]